MIGAFSLLLFLPALFYALFRSGKLSVSQKRAALFLASRDGKRIRFADCSGSVLRMIRLREDGEYRFTFTAELTKGDASVEILGADKAPLLCLTAEEPCGCIALKRAERCAFRFRFDGATGSVAVDWQKT